MSCDKNWRFCRHNKEKRKIKDVRGAKMKKTGSSKGKFSKFLSGKGFYAVLAFCLIGTGAAAWVAVDSTVNSISNENQKKTSSSTEISQNPTVSQQSWGFPDENEQAEANVSDVPVTSQPESDSSSRSSSQQPVFYEPSEPLSEQDVYQELQPDAFILPIESEVFGSFSNGELVKNLTMGDWRTHDGIDIKAENGTDILAAADGVVGNIYEDPRWGKVVELEHKGDITTVYCGVAETGDLQVGDEVKICQVIGKVGSIPSEISLEDHLHFGIKMDGKWVDPLVAMNKMK